MALQLVVEKGADKGVTYDLTQEGYFTIGRGSNNAIQLDDEMVSRQHCRFRFRENRLFIQDMDSRNGTQVNFRTVLKAIEVKQGDVIQVGETEIMLSVKQADGLIGQTIANYKFNKRLGRGGEGVVYKARQINLDREVAIKVLDPRLAGQQKYRERFVKEARFAATMNHHRLIGVFDIIEQDDIVFFSMEYMVNGSLGEMAMEQKTLPYADVVNCIQQAAEGLVYLNEKGMVHRDIKPANLMLDKEYQVKLGDFGTATEGEQTGVNEGNVMGSPSFMSPEHIQGQPLDSRSDLYSLGCTAFRLMAGVPPFLGGTVREILEAHLNENPPSFIDSVPRIPEHIAEKFDILLNKDPEERYQNAQEFIEALQEAPPRGGRRRRHRRVVRSARRPRSGRASPNRIIRKKRS